jgi:hypothetical protein
MQVQVLSRISLGVELSRSQSLESAVRGVEALLTDKYRERRNICSEPRKLEFAKAWLRPGC